MDAKRFIQMLRQNSETLDLTELFPEDRVRDSSSHPTPSPSPPKYTPFSIRDILGLNQPTHIRTTQAATGERRVPSTPPGYLTPSESSSDDQISDSSYEADDSSYEADDSSEGSPNQEKARAGRRQAYSSYQVRELEREFATTSYPERETIQRLAVQTGLTAKQVKVWFQNRRQKYKSAARSGGRGWLLRSAPRVLRSHLHSDPEPCDLSVQSNQFPSHDRSVLPSQHLLSVAALPKNPVFQRMPSGEIPDWSPVLTANVPARRVPKYHPYTMSRCVSRGSVLRPSPDPHPAMAALMRQQRTALHSRLSEVNN